MFAPDDALMAEPIHGPMSIGMSATLPYCK